MMKIKAITNCESENGIISIYSEKSGIIISGFELEFDFDFGAWEIDHCQCIAASIIKEGRLLIFTTVTQRGGIDEYITISVFGDKNKHFKIRFVRL